MTTPADQRSATSSDELASWLRDGWRIMTRHFPALVLIGLLADVPLTFISRSTGNIDNGFLSTSAGLAAIAIITPLAKAASIVAIDSWERERPSAVATAFRALARRLHVLLAASILWATGVFLGMGLLIVPGVIVLVLGQCLMGAIIQENRSILDAARRTVALVKPRFLPVLALFLIVQATAGITSSVLEAIGGLVLDGWLLDVATRALTSPIAFAPLAVMFLRRSAATR